VIAKAPCQVILTAPPASESRKAPKTTSAVDGDGHPAAEPASR
jgi:hypothetical protein